MPLLPSAAVVGSVALCGLLHDGVNPGVRGGVVSMAVAVLVRYPLNYTSIVLRGGFAFIFSWLASFKLLCFLAGRGPLAPRQPWPVWKFVVFCLLPLYPPTEPTAAGKPQPAQAAPHAQRRWGLTLGQEAALKAAAVLAISFLLPHYNGPLWTLHCVYALLVWLLVCVLLDSPRSAAAPLLGALRPGMDAPFAAASVRDFWGRRYNLIVSRTLRDAVYTPILEAAAARTRGGGPPTWGTKLVALTAAFAVSGVMHQVMLWYMCWRWYSGMLLFFLLQPLLVAAELAAAALLPPAAMSWWCAPRGVPRVARTLATLGLLLVSGEAFFWPPFDDCGAAHHIPREVRQLVACLLSWLPRR